MASIWPGGEPCRPRSAISACGGIVLNNDHSFTPNRMIPKSATPVPSYRRDNDRQPTVPGSTVSLAALATALLMSRVEHALWPKMRGGAFNIATRVVPAHRPAERNRIHDHERIIIIIATCPTTGGRSRSVRGAGRRPKPRGAREIGEDASRSGRSKGIASSARPTVEWTSNAHAAAVEQERRRQQQQQEEEELWRQQREQERIDGNIARFRAVAARPRQRGGGGGGGRRVPASAALQSLDGSIAMRRMALLAPFGGFPRRRATKGGSSRGAGWHKRGWRYLNNMWINVKAGSEYTRGQEVRESSTLADFVWQVQESQNGMDFRPEGTQTWDLLFRKKSLRQLLRDLEAEGLEEADVLVRDLFDCGETVYYRIYNEDGKEQKYLDW
ncbi:hypothetical protein VP1G_03864 [Cytospora mali]|uniref:Uncharacterized protein n=1 Tax=Cytospora mali TaxID=578113 RepID=A0A194UYA9_CYTMA|nr:hypothetical protein VP1G_03864 [Valsa mali var. pyri (nom. inval.)]